MFATVPSAVASASSVSYPMVPPNGCIRSQGRDGLFLSSGLGAEQAESLSVKQGEGSILGGHLRGPAGGVAGAWICIYSKVVTETGSTFLGITITGPDGGYQFAVPPGPSQNFTAVYESDQGQLTATTLLQTSASPSLKLNSGVVHPKHFAYFSGQIPGPDNDEVLVVLQVQSGKGWRVFRRYSTRDDGRFTMRYRFTRTYTPTTYVIRAQVLGAPGYPYLAGNSRALDVHVLP